jgi:N4-gp56 family major capsid protein
MAITQTGTSNLDLVLTGYEKLAYFALRPELFFDSVCEVGTTDLTAPGSSVKFTIFNELAAATTALGEATDVSPVTIDDAQVTVTLAEYGNAVQTSAKLRALAFMAVNPIVANVLGYNAGISVDSIARNAAQGGTNVRYSGDATSRATLGTASTADTLSGNDVRRAVAELRSANVATYNGAYKGIIHPDVSYDFRGATGGTNWSDPHVYSDPSGIFNGVIGSFQGVQFMESPRAPLFADAGNGAGGTGTIDAYGTLIMGRQALAKAYSTGGGYSANPVMVDVPVTDALRRFEGMGWKHLVGYGVFRQAALRRIESASSIGANA